MGLYRYVITDKNGDEIAEVSTARERRFGLYLNRAGDAHFMIQPTEPTLKQSDLLLGHKELRVYRANKLVWGGELVYARTDMGVENEGLRVTAKGYFDLFDKRVIGTAASPVAYTDTDLSDIASDLITDSQALTHGDLGITIGTTPTTRNADRTYSYKNLKDAILGLSNENVQNGFDFEITPEKTFNVYYPTKGRQLSNVVFEWGINIDRFFQISDATEMVNQAIVLGAGEGGAMITSTRNADSYLQETYRLRQGVLYHKDVTESATLESHGDKELAVNQVQTQIIGVTTKGNLAPGFGAYEVGDRVRVIVEHGLIHVDGYYRIYGIDVGISEENEETITLIFNPN